MQASHESTIANTPEPPYYAVVFTSLRTQGDNGGGVSLVLVVQDTYRESRT